MSNRQKIIRAITESKVQVPVVDYTKRPLEEVFGENAFDERVQKKRLSQDVFQALQNTIKSGVELDAKIADSVAQAMMEWALEKGATHYCHWFQPLTDLTAEKHDGFFNPTKAGGMVAEFSGKELVRGEPDASSFPTGGLRTTFEARGYTAWDPSSPAFILETVNGAVLLIPTMFLSWVGDALDKKTPLLRSIEVLSKHALRILRLFGDKETKRVITTVGAEQEYFLIDKHFYHSRPDLLSCGRTLFGAKPTKGQELEDQYLGAIPRRVLTIMSEMEYEMIRLGVPVKTRHNEVAPSQYEIAVNFQPASLAADHQMLVMEMLKKVADRHGMTCLLHEKPFAGVNGSGKHNNWSMAKGDGTNLLEPGETPHENAQFLVFCAATIRAVHRHAKLLRLSVASAGNDHRLGVHEAPPAIMSVFLGEQLSAIFQTIRGGEASESKHERSLEIGISLLPRIPRHSSDRNRTSPFAFTGNKFEFRAVGSSENISKANTILNTIVAESLDDFATELEEAVQQGKDLNKAVQELLSREAKIFEPVQFEGDNYNTEWREEAAKRKLPNVTNAVDAINFYTSEESVALFTKYKVHSERELAARRGIGLAKYIKKVHIEAETASTIVHTMILPAALNYLREVGEASQYSKHTKEFLKKLSDKTHAAQRALGHLDDMIHKEIHNGVLGHAVYMRDRMLPAIAELRSHVDGLELLVADADWPLPKYREMLFIR